MSLQARTNAFGWTYYPDELVSNHYAFERHDGYRYSEDSLQGAHMGACGRFGHSGNHRDPTSYYREVVEVVDNQPYHMEESYFYGAVPDKYIYEYYLSSGLQNPAFWEYPQGYKNQKDNAKAKHDVKMRNKLRQRKEFQLGNAIGESKQTLELLGGTATGMWNLLLSLKRGRPGAEFRKFMGLTERQLRDSFGRTAVQRYLEVQYGWKPLAQDCYDLYQRLTDDTKRELSLTVKGEDSFSYDDTPYFYERQTWEGKLFSKITARISNDYSREMDGWGLLNPLSIAWELTPFSFMIDWGIPVGNVLQSMTATAGLEFVNGYTSDINDGTRHLTSSVVDDIRPTYTKVVSNKGSHVTKYYVFGRTPLNGFPIPALYGRDNPFSSQHIANALAVFAQLRL